MGHGLDQCGLDIVAFAELVAEAEDHQQGVVDRHAEADERDEELDDDRDVRDVGQRPDEREGVEDRGDRDRERYQHGRERPEDEQQDHERAKPADHSLQQHARASAGPVFRCFLERVVTGHVDGDPRREALGCRGAHAFRAGLRVEPGRPRRVDLGEGRVPVAREVHGVAGREVGARACARHRGNRAIDRLRDPLVPACVAARVEDDDVRRAYTHTHGLERPLARLVGGLARDGEALVPARGELPGGDAPEQCQDDPEADHRPAATGGEMGQTAERRLGQVGWRWHEAPPSSRVRTV